MRSHVAIQLNGYSIEWHFMRWSQAVKRWLEPGKQMRKKRRNRCLIVGHVAKNFLDKTNVIAPRHVLADWEQHRQRHVGRAYAGHSRVGP